MGIMEKEMETAKMGCIGLVLLQTCFSPYLEGQRD